MLVSCGLSILTNGLKESFKIEQIYKHANKKEDELKNNYSLFFKEFNREYERLKEKVKQKSIDELKKFSAEFKSIFTYEEKPSDINIYRLLVTDTYLCKKAAELVKHVLENKGAKNVS